MIATTDQLKRKINLTGFSDRIISLVPSLTELLFSLDLNEEVIGITKFCVHPESWFHSKKRIGGTKDVKLDVIRSLNPNLIIANKEENNSDQVNTLMKEFPVWVSDIDNLDDALEMIVEVSKITNREKNGESLIIKIQKEFELLKIKVDEEITCAYLIWENPYMTIGGDTFISDILKMAGFKNIFSERHRYPEISSEELRNYSPKVILISSEPYPFNENSCNYFRNNFPLSSIFLVDGEMFSWYGSHLLKAPAYFLDLRKKIKSAL